MSGGGTFETSVAEVMEVCETAEWTRITMLIGYARTSTVDQVAEFEVNGPPSMMPGARRSLPSRSAAWPTVNELKEALDYIREGMCWS